jgi:cytochrome b subunit of formate dehydrogenase
MFLKILYWVAVVAISVALVIGLILWLESRDASKVEDAGNAEPVTLRA